VKARFFILNGFCDATESKDTHGHFENILTAAGLAEWIGAGRETEWPFVTDMWVFGLAREGYHVGWHPVLPGGQGTGVGVGVGVGGMGGVGAVGGPTMPKPLLCTPLAPGMLPVGRRKMFADVLGQRNEAINAAGGQANCYVGALPLTASTHGNALNKHSDPIVRARYHTAYIDQLCYCAGTPTAAWARHLAGRGVVAGGEAIACTDPGMGHAWAVDEAFPSVALDTNIANAMGPPQTTDMVHPHRYPCRVGTLLRTGEFRDPAVRHALAVQRMGEGIDVHVETWDFTPEQTRDLIKRAS